MDRRETAELIKAISGKIAITAHEYPDGDAVGSVLGWANFLNKLKDVVHPVLKDGVPSYLDFLPSAKSVKREFEGFYDWIIILDVSSIQRTGFAELPAKNILIIDHHRSAKPFSKYFLIEPEISSTCELSLEVMKLVSSELIDESVAVPIYTGMLTDTGSFSYNSTTARTFENAAFLVKRGAKPYEIYKNVFERNSLERIKLLEKVLSTLELSLDGKVGMITLFKRFLEETGAKLEDSEGFVNYPKSIKGVEVAVFFKEMDENLFRVSLRSKGEVDVCSIAESFGGGGHKMAAAFEWRGSLRELKEKLLLKISKELSF